MSTIDDEIDPSQLIVMREIIDYIDGVSLISLSQGAINYLLADNHDYVIDYVKMGLNLHVVRCRGESLFNVMSREWSVEQFLDLIVSANLVISRDYCHRLLKRYTDQVNSTKIINDEVVNQLVNLYYRLPYRTPECTRLLHALCARSM